MHDVDQIFAGIAQAFARLAEQEQRQRANRRLEVNARRRQRYAARKIAGTLPPRNRSRQHLDTEADPPTGCYCHAVTMPPCSWCEDGSPTEETPC